MSVNGGWTEYNIWSECSVTCGGGNQTRNRSCTNPSPSFGGRQCTGSSIENRVCGTEHCPGKLVRSPFKEAPISVKLHSTSAFIPKSIFYSIFEI